MRVIVEPACGAALSLLYDNAHMLDAYETVFVVVCGGAGATMQDLVRWSDEVTPVATS
jgi:L-serine/L-threonine ammonia-lyase